MEITPKVDELGLFTAERREIPRLKAVYGHSFSIRREVSLILLFLGSVLEYPVGIKFCNILPRAHQDL